MSWSSRKPYSKVDQKLSFITKLSKAEIKVSEIINLELLIQNNENEDLSMPTAIIGIPAGLSLDMAHLKRLKDEKRVSFFEIFDNYLVLYFDGVKSNDKIALNVLLKAEIAGSFTAPASCVYLYYNDQEKVWLEGIKAKINL